MAEFVANQSMRHFQSVNQSIDQPTKSYSPFSLFWCVRKGMRAGLTAKESGRVKSEAPALSVPQLSQSACDENKNRKKSEVQEILKEERDE